MLSFHLQIRKLKSDTDVLSDLHKAAGWITYTELGLALNF